jgi:hypothetical protein
LGVDLNPFANGLIESSSGVLSKHWVSSFPVGDSYLWKSNSKSSGMSASTVFPRYVKSKFVELCVESSVGASVRTVQYP